MKKMKKIIVLLLCAFFVLVFFAACEKEKPSAPEDLDPAIVTPDGTQDSGVVDPPPADTCEHEWELTAFVTEETTVPFAGKFVCGKCKKVEVKSFSYTDIEIPLVNIEGDISEISKENKVNVNVKYQSRTNSFESAATMKLQGNSSLSWPKNNFSVTLRDDSFDKKNKVIVNNEWGAQSKYCLKADYEDPSYSRNLIMSDLYGQIAKTRDAEDEYSALPNGGAVDGFMVLVYLNGKYFGIYNWNIPKDKWLFDMGDDDAGEAVLFGSSNLLDDGGITVEEDAESHWEVEYCNTDYSDNGNQWAVDSFNEMLRFSINAGVSKFRENASRYLNVDRTIDAVLFSCIFGGRDNIHANLLFCTYDAVHWTPIVYDLDETLGRDGGDIVETDGFADCVGNPIYRAVLVAFYPEIRARYFSLRERILTTENIMGLIADLTKVMDERYFNSEINKWQNAGWQRELSADGSRIDSFAAEFSYIENYIESRLAFCDRVISTEDPSMPGFGAIN